MFFLKTGVRFFKYCLPVVFLSFFQSVLANENADVVYRINASLDTTRNVLTASQKVTYKHSVDRPVSELVFNLMPNFLDKSRMEKNLRHADFFTNPTEAIFVGEKNLGRIAIIAVKLGDDSISYRVESGLLTIPLPSMLKQGISLEVEIQFEYFYPSVDFAYTMPMSRKNVFYDWFPQLAYLDETRGWIREMWRPNCDFDVTLRIPARYAVIGGGNLVEDVQMQTYDFSLRSSPTFAFILLDKYKVLTRQAGDITVRYYHFPYPQDGKKAREALGYLPAERFLDLSVEIVRFFSDYIGSYPYSKLDICEVDDFGSLFLAAGTAFPSLVAINRSLLPMEVLGDGYESLLAHEIAHQWFGISIVSDYNQGDILLSESLAMNAEVLYMEHKYGIRKNYLANLPDKSFKTEPVRSVFKAFQVFIPQIREDDFFRSQYYAQSSVAVQDSLTNPHAVENSITKINANYYIKGHYVFQMLRFVLGDSVYKDILTTYYERHRFKTASMNEFIAIAEEVSNQSLNWFFEQWLGSKKHCDYELESVETKKTANGYFHKIRISRKEEIIMPFDYELYLSGGKKVRQRVWGDFRDTTLTVFTNEPLENVIIDPDKKILETSEYNNYHKKNIIIKPLINPFDITKTMYDPFDRTSYQINYWMFPWYDNTDRFTFSIRSSVNRYPWFVNSPEATSSVLSLSGGVTHLSKTGSLAYDLDFTSYAGFPLRNSYIDGRFAFKEQLLESSIGITSVLTDDPFSSYFTAISISARRNSLGDQSYYSPLQWEQGVNNSLNVTVKLSRRLSDWFPVKGFFAGVQFQTGLEAFDGSYSYQKYKVNFEYYLPLISKTTLAINVFGGKLYGHAPVQELFRFGRDGNIRSSEIQDRFSAEIVGVNAELRYSLNPLFHSSVFLNLLGQDFDRVREKHYGFPINEAGISLNLLGSSPISIGIYFPLWGNTFEGSPWRLKGVSIQVGRIFSF